MVSLFPTSLFIQKIHLIMFLLLLFIPFSLSCSGYLSFLLGKLIPFPNFN